jgi:predicted metal-dependent hydrolase
MVGDRTGIHLRCKHSRKNHATGHADKELSSSKPWDNQQLSTIGQSIAGWRRYRTPFTPRSNVSEIFSEADEAGAPPAPVLMFVRSLRARQYRLTLRKDGVAVATVPARGSEREARAFVEQHREWLERARARQARRPRLAAVWTIGIRVLWRGELAEIRSALEAPLIPAGIPVFVPETPRAAGFPGKPLVCLAADVFRVTALAGDLRPALEAQFARRARIELPGRTWELAAVTGADVKQVTVRNQRSRWGSCSAGGTISLNWRLVQTPDSVRDYIIYHELMHLREMNHSPRFWARVAEVCPGWRDAEQWLKRNGSLLGM